MIDVEVYLVQAHLATCPTLEARIVDLNSEIQVTEWTCNCDSPEGREIWESRRCSLDVIPSEEPSVRCGCACGRMVHECPFEYRQGRAAWLRYCRETGTRA